MEKIATVGVDIAMSVFQVHGVHAQGTVTISRHLKRRQDQPFFKSFPPALSASRPAPRRTIGRASFKRSAIRFGSCRINRPNT